MRIVKTSLLGILLLVSACGGGGGGGSSPPTNTQGPYSIGGVVSGLNGTGLQLQVNGSENIDIVSNGNFQFTTLLQDLDSYIVTVNANPRNLSQTCTITNATGMVSGSNVTNVGVLCVTNSYTIGGTVSGLRGASLELRNSGVEDLTVNTNGTFQFINSLDSGSNYALSVLTQPDNPDQTCVITNPAGIVSDSDINVNINCRALTAIEISANFSSTCTILENDRLKCWGFNDYGGSGIGTLISHGSSTNQMGDDLPFVLDSISKVVTGLHSCAIHIDGNLKCWGHNNSGQLGLGHTNNIGDEQGEMGLLTNMDLGTGRTVLQVDVGFEHTCALLDNNQVKCWGQNGLGQLGLGGIQNYGDNTNEMGDNLPEVRIGSILRTVRQISLGDNHSCVLLDNSEIKCWGDNSQGQLGYGDTDIRGDALADMGTQLPIVDLGTGLTATQVSAGNEHTCALLNTGQVKCWGNNNRGQLGLADTQDRGDEPGEMGDNLRVVPLGINPITGSAYTAVKVTAGFNYTCVLLDDGQIKCWGSNSIGQLGQGDTLTRGDEPGELAIFLPTIDLGTGRSALDVVAGDNHTCALLDTYEVKCWGGNANGQLGQEHTLNIGDDINQMGDALQVIDLGSP